MPVLQNEKDRSAFLAPQFWLPLGRVLDPQAVRYAHEAGVMCVGRKLSRRECALRKLSADLRLASLEGEGLIFL